MSMTDVEIFRKNSERRLLILDFYDSLSDSQKY